MSHKMNLAKRAVCGSSDIRVVTRSLNVVNMDSGSSYHVYFGEIHPSSMSW